jgi:hypothetical protein
MDKHPEAGILIHNKIGKRLVNTIFSSTYLSQYLVSFVQNFLTIHLSLIRFNWKDAQPRFPRFGERLPWGGVATAIRAIRLHIPLKYQD